METTMEKVNTMEMTTHTYKELADLLQGLLGVTELKGVKFSLQVTKNIKLIKSELEALEEASKPTDEFMVIAQEVQKIEANETLSDEDKKKTVLELEEEHKDLVDSRKKQIEEFNVLILEETEVSLFKVSEKHLPSDINSKQLLGINLIIKE